MACGLGSSVSITTGYWLDGPGIESRLGWDFLHLSRLALGPTQPPVQWVQGLSRGAWCWPLTPFQCCGHERVELYLYSPYGLYGLYRASVPVQGWPLPLLFFFFFTDGIPAELLKHGRQEVINKIQKLMGIIWEKESIPEEQKLSIIRSSDKTRLFWLLMPVNVNGVFNEMVIRKYY